MPRIVVNVMPKPELLDPQGKAVTRALARNNFDDITEVRQGKRFELTVAGPITAELRAEVERIANDVLANTVIEDVVSIDYAE